MARLGQEPTPAGPARVSTLWRESEAAARQLRRRGLPKAALGTTLRYFLLDGPAPRAPHAQAHTHTQSFARAIETPRGFLPLWRLKRRRYAVRLLTWPGAHRTGGGGSAGRPGRPWLPLRERCRLKLRPRPSRVGRTRLTAPTAPRPPMMPTVPSRPPPLWRGQGQGPRAPQR
jgi:hypothetical protein